MFHEKLARYGQWTYRGAWAIEIVAAILGLTTGIALGWQAYTASETGSAFDLGPVDGFDQDEACGKCNDGVEVALCLFAA